jgi:hypothetical protein
MDFLNVISVMSIFAWMIVVMSTDAVHDVVNECDVQDVLDVLNDFDFREEYEIHINVDKYECGPDVIFAVSRERKQNITFREEGGSQVFGCLAVCATPQLGTVTLRPAPSDTVTIRPMSCCGLATQLQLYD